MPGDRIYKCSHTHYTHTHTHTRWDTIGSERENTIGCENHPASFHRITTISPKHTHRYPTNTLFSSPFVSLSTLTVPSTDHRFPLVFVDVVVRVIIVSTARPACVFLYLFVCLKRAPAALLIRNGREEVRHACNRQDSAAKFPANSVNPNIVRVQFSEYVAFA